MNTTQDSGHLEQRLRHTLNAVAEAVADDAAPAATAPSPVQKRSRKCRILLGAGVLAVPLTVAAAGLAHHGSEYVDTIPTERIVSSGAVDGSRYVLIRSDRTDKCGRPAGGVELVEEEKNLLGSEWNTSGYRYGPDVSPDCDAETSDESQYLQNPALFNASGAQVGDSFVWVYAVHPDVDTVRITSGAYTEDLVVHEVGGAGYATFEIPKAIDKYTSELLIDGRAVPGSEETRVVHRP